MTITQFKVFGERNTGTNWVEKLLIQNYDIPIVHHKGIVKEFITDEQKRFLNSLKGIEKLMARERIIDSIFENEAQKLLGWKHSCVSIEKLSLSNSIDETGFIFLVKNPTSYIKSLFKNPYNRLTNIPDSLEDFVKSPWLTVRRDNIRKPLLCSPVELWNYKSDSYLKFIRVKKNGIILRYEDLLANYELLFDKIEAHFGVKAKLRKPILISTKSDHLTTDDYKRKYLANPKEQAFTGRTKKAFDKIIDQRLIEELNYSL